MTILSKEEFDPGSDIIVRISRERGLIGGSAPAPEWGVLSMYGGDP